jgi:VanZ family protein
MVWAAFILSLSSDRFSDVHTAAWLSGIAGALGISLPLVEVANFIVRKSAHFVEYAVLSLLTLRAMLVTWPQRRRRQLLVCAVFAAAAWASVDELHQHFFTLTRMGTPKDVVLDTSGALAGAVVGASYLYRRARRPAA